MATISERIRTRKPQLIETWQSVIHREIPELERLNRASLIDHLPEFLDALAAWIEGDTRTARLGFEALADGHAIQRLGYGVDLRTLTREYAVLRSVLLRELVEEPDREGMLRLDEGLDEAMCESVRRYAEGRDQIRDRFIAILAHDLRSPLNAVSLAGATLELTASDPPLVRKSASVITASAARMAQLVSDLLDVARADLAGGIPVALVPANLASLVERVVDEARVAHPERQLRVRCQGDLTGMFDDSRVMQALANLVGNAIEHGQDPVEIAAHETEDRRALVTSVTSHGRVIDPVELAQLFDPFRRTAESKGL
ncbi:MAG TPA: HAMP domain-containing sensor histidine kinase, partial [Kofleriaceae bacterium]